VFRRVGVRLLVGQLHGGVQLVALHDGLLRGQLRAHVPRFRRLHAGLLERPLPDLLRRWHMQRRLLGGPLQHVVPERRHVHRLVPERRMPARVHAGRDVLLLELLVRRMLLHGSRLSLTDARQLPPHPPELQGTQVPASALQVTLPAVQVPCWQHGCPLAPQLPLPQLPA
jgi:hypothetical protein